MSTMTLDEAQVVASLCRESFFHFVQEFWSVNIPQKPVWNWHVPYLCGVTQAAAERVFAGKPKRWDYIFNVPPGTTKSTILSVMFPAWAWTRMPEAQFICGSYTYNLALDLARKSRTIIESEKYQTVFPDIKLSADQNTKGHFANTKNGMRYSIGSGGNVTGMHGHFLLVDDPINPLGAVSEEEINTANQWISEALLSRKINKENAVFMLIMQRLHQNDPAGYMLAKKGTEAIKQISIPGELTDDVKPTVLRRYYTDGIMDVTRMPRKVLDELKVDLGIYGYACQILQSPVPLGGGTFKTDKLMVGTPPEQFVKVVRFWDKAGTLYGGAYTVGLKMGLTWNPVLKCNNFWILDVIRGQWDSGMRENQIMRAAAMDGKGVLIGVEQEPGSGGKESAQGTAGRLAGYRVSLISPSGDKTVRADEYSTQVNAGNVYMAPGMWNKDLIEEYKYFPNSTYKDQVDAGSGAFSMLNMPLRRVGAL